LSATPSPADAILELVRGDGLLREAAAVVTMYSGGQDSTCLLDLAVRIAGPEKVTALHVNYGLRDAADAEARHCAAVCERLGARFELRRPRRPATGNVQAWARDERYGAAARIALEQGADVATGHTATDQVETILYRLASSPSRRALLGMSPRDGRLIRPLLRFSRPQTAEYCRARGLDWREDESNTSDAYARNRIRAGLLAALQEIHPAAEQNVLALAATLREEAAVLDRLVEDLLGGRDEFPLEELRALAPATRALVIQRMADDAVGGIAPGAARRADQVAALTTAGTSELDLGAGLRAVSEYGSLRIERRRPGVPTPAPPVRLGIPGRVSFAGREIHCDLGPPARAPGVLDRDTLGPDLLVRSWRPGDRMRPLGLNGSKSLQDLFTARRVPRDLRGSVAVVESGGEIAWVAGVATAERFKVTEATTQAVRLSLGAEPVDRAVID
jgi:tRNA(Ile)-lysidine synthase